MNTIKNKYEKYLKLEERISTASMPQKSLSKRLNCLKRYERQLMAAGLISTSILIPTGDLSAQLDPNSTGEEITVNQNFTGAQDRPDIAVASDGDFVVVWRDACQTLNTCIFGRLYNADGTPKSDEFVIANSNTFTFKNPAVTIHGDGDFIVAWELQQVSGSTYYSIQAQKYTQSGAADGSQITVDSHTFYSLDSPDIASDPLGNFVITWNEYNGSFDQVYYKRYSASGSTFIEFNVSNPSNYDQYNSTIGMDAGGDFIIAWSEDDTSYYSIRAQKYTAAGSASSAFLIHGFYTFSDRAIRPEVDMDDDGRFAVTFENGRKGAAEIWAKNYDINCVPIASGFKINPLTSINQRRPAIAMLDEGKFIITWQEEEEDNDLRQRDGNINTRDVDGYGILAQVFNASGTPEGELLDVNTTTDNDQLRPVVGSDDNGNFTIAWQSDDQDSDDYGVITRQLTSVAAPIPTLSQWGIIILGLFVSIFGLIGIKNKKKAPIKVRS